MSSRLHLSVLVIVLGLFSWISTGISQTTIPSELSEETKVCIECHSTEFAAIYQQWGGSKHFRANVGCYECHQAAESDADAFDHNGYNISIIVSPKDCARCHSNDPAATPMRDAAGRDVAPFDLWRASPMANAARDPIYRAQVEVEMAATPALSAAIETKCLPCHAPAGAAAAKLRGQTLRLADLSGDTEVSHLALDGVSCTTCHQIQAVADVPLIIYHKHWTYLLDWTGLEDTGEIEHRPGIQPSPRHVQAVIERGRQLERVTVICAQWDHLDIAEEVADRIGAPLAILPGYSGSLPGSESYLDFIEMLIDGIVTASSTGSES